MSLNSETLDQSAKIHLCNKIIEKRETSRILMKLLMAELDITYQDTDTKIFEELAKLEDEFAEATMILRDMVKREYSLQREIPDNGIIELNEKN